MKLRYLATVVLLALKSLTTVAAHAQSDTQVASEVGLYFNPLAINASNSVMDSVPAYNFYPNGATSQLFWGFDIGGYYDFFHAGSLDAGLDIRDSDLHANNALLKNFLVGARISAHPFQRPFRPYLQASVGVGTTKAPQSTLHISKLDYAIFAGVDYTLQRHVDFRAAEIGYGSLITVSGETVGGQSTVPIPASKLISFSTGFVFHF
jgi:hypothetical protein